MSTQEDIKRARADIRKMIEGGVGELATLLQELAETEALTSENDGARRPRTIVLPIDQGEELSSMKGTTRRNHFSP